MFFIIITLLALDFSLYADGMQIYQYETPLVSLKVGNGWIINGNFKLVHVINLERYMEMTDNISSLVQQHIPPSKNKEFILHRMQQMQERLSELIKKRHVDQLIGLGQRGNGWPEVQMRQIGIPY